MVPREQTQVIQLAVSVYSLNHVAHGCDFGSTMPAVTSQSVPTQRAGKESDAHLCGAQAEAR